MSDPADVDGETWSFSIHEFGDRRNRCDNVGNAIDFGPDGIINDAIFDRANNPQMQTQDGLDLQVRNLIGHSVLMSTLREDEPNIF